MHRIEHDRRRHRLHRAHRAREELARRVQHDARRDAGRPRRRATPIERAKLAPEEVDDVLIGCALPEGATGWNIARQIALRAGCPVTVPGATVNRFCSSGLQTIALAAQRIMTGEARRDRRRRRRVDLVRAERAEPAHASRGVARRAQARDLLVDAGDRRDGGAALRHLARAPGRVRRAEPAARRGGRRGRPLRRPRSCR